MTCVLVTGATGFVGRALCPALRDAGHEVIAAVRHATAPFPPDISIRAISDIGPGIDWAPHLAGIDAIVHLAARVHRLGESGPEALAENRRINRDGTRALGAAAVKAGVRRFVFVSSVKVNGENTNGRGPFTEDDPARPGDAYAISKWEAEEALRELAAKTGLEVAVVRPPLVYGEGVKANFLALLKLCRRAPPLPLGGIDNRRSLIYVGNLANALVRCVSLPAAAGRTFLVRDGEDVSTAELIRRVAAALGRPARLFPVPPAALRFMGRLAGRDETAARLLDTLVVDDRRIRRDLGWSPPFTVTEGLARTAAWFLSSGEI